mmetsp:Transcript_1754/g.6966  ORF Transcript_1754/g.6966 Transcript_1754/m.6966 type:complete len:217 (-) Transcript_1754:1640-2290(-)
MEARNRPGRPRSPASCTVLPTMGEPRATRIAIMNSISELREPCTISRSRWHSRRLAGSSTFAANVAVEGAEPSPLAASWEPCAACVAAAESSVCESAGASMVTDESSTPDAPPFCACRVPSTASLLVLASLVTAGAAGVTKLLAMRLNAQRDGKATDEAASLAAASSSGTLPAMSSRSAEFADTCMMMMSPRSSSVCPIWPCSCSPRRAMAMIAAP